MCICHAASDGGHDPVDEASVVFGACRKGEKSRHNFDLLTFHANIIAVHPPPNLTNVLTITLSRFTSLTRRYYVFTHCYPQKPRESTKTLSAVVARTYRVYKGTLRKEHNVFCPFSSPNFLETSFLRLECTKHDQHIRSSKNVSRLILP